MLFYHVFGPTDGRPVLFLHPANVPGQIWKGPVSGLSGVKGICPDLPGFGGSVDVPFSGFDAAADHVAAILQGLEHGAVPVVGYSYGAYVGLCLAHRHPDLVERLMFVSGQVSSIKGAWWMVPLTAVMTPLLAGRRAREKGLAQMGIAPDSRWFPDDVGACRATALFKIGAAALRYSAKDIARTLEMPVLAIAGQNEHAAMRETTLFFENDVASAQGRLAPGGHGWPAKSPDLFSASVEAFLNDTQLPVGLLMPG